MRIIQQIVILIFTINTYNAQSKIEHKLVLGYNFGATTPTVIPVEVRSINSYKIGFTPQLGYSLAYEFDRKWALQSGFLFDFKGMTATDRVKYMYTDVVMGGENIKGYFVGKNETKVRIVYFTIPINVEYKLTDLWTLKAGTFLSFNIGAKFSGTVWGGYLRETEEEDIVNSMKINIEKKGDASFSFGDEIQNLEMGISLGAERKINNKIGVFTMLNWGLTPIFPSGFKGVDVTMYNVYLALGVTYKL